MWTKTKNRGGRVTINTTFALLLCVTESEHTIKYNVVTDAKGMLRAVPDNMPDTDDAKCNCEDWRGE